MNKFRLLILIVLLIASTGAIVAQETAPVRRTLDIFYIDVEGGAATLIVTPAGESILGCSSPRPAHRYWATRAGPASRAATRSASKRR
jgi:hypothetical protein